MVVRAVQRLPLRNVLSRGDGPHAACLATQFKEELRRIVATHSPLDALSRTPSRTTSDRDMSDIDGRSDSTSKPSCGCVTCNKEAPETDVRPWQKVGTDLFMYKNATYLLVVYCDSSYIEIAKLAETTASDVILHLRAIFARHGIPQTVVSDNGPQYASYECWGLPVLPGEQWQSGRTVQIVKAKLKK